MIRFRLLWLAAALALTAPAAAQARPHKHVCGAAARGDVRCHADVVTDRNGAPGASSGPAGLNPADLQSAYNLVGASATAGATRRVAIVDAYDDPNAAADLAVYRSRFGLPPCTSANGCFTKVNQNGGSTPPRKNGGWAQEISLDLDMVSAVCPNCRILLVEASSNSFANLLAAEDYAARNADVISNSWGANEFSSETSYDSHFNVGRPITVSSGDSGFGAEYPAASRYVTAVGGTTLARAANARGWNESAWAGAGAGCSAYELKPTWQTDAGCSRRTIADVSAVADPNTGVSVYDTFQAGGWLVFGGTSVSAPITASVFALNGSGGSATPYAHTGDGALNDVVSGSDGNCSVAYLCTAGPGFDGPTGLGTPNGIAAF